MAAPVVACTTGMKTPSTSTVTSTVAIAANDGTALRDSERIASRKKKPEAHQASAAPQPDLHLARGRLAQVAAGALVADDLAVASSMTRRRMRSTIGWSCVATTTVVPVRLMR